jgi:predicted transposase/invertase (TIGR01784 family)
MQLLSPLWDYVFKFIFRNQEVLAAFLSAVLRLPGTELSSLSVSDPFLFKRWKKDKLGILDIKVRTPSGKIITVEVQVEKQYAMRNRILYYISRLIGEQLKAGDDYEAIGQVITVVICDHILIPDEQGYMNRYELRNNRSGKLFTDLAGIVILELPKVPAEEAGGKSWVWMKFLSGGSEEELEMLGKRDAGLRKAVELLKVLSGSEAHRRRAEAREKWRRDQKAREKYQYMEGLARGMEQG